MNNYIIVNVRDYDDFSQEVRTLQAMGLTFTTSFIEDVTDRPDSGGWGCARFNMEPPLSKIFNVDDTEFRWSQDLNAWTVEGAVYEDQPFIDGLYNYFKQIAEGGQ